MLFICRFYICIMYYINLYILFIIMTAVFVCFELYISKKLIIDLHSIISAKFGSTFYIYFD